MGETCKLGPYTISIEDDEDSERGRRIIVQKGRPEWTVIVYDDGKSLDVRALRHDEYILKTTCPLL